MDPIDKLYQRVLPGENDLPAADEPDHSAEQLDAINSDIEKATAKIVLTRLSSEQRVRLSRVTAAANPLVDEAYERLLRRLHRFSGRLPSPTVFSTLRSTRGALATLSRGAEPLALSMLQGAVDALVPVQRAVDGAEAILDDPEGHAGAGIGDVDLRGLLSSVASERDRLDKRSARRGRDMERIRQGLDELRAESADATERLGKIEEVNRLREVAKHGLPKAAKEATRKGPARKKKED